MLLRMRELVDGLAVRLHGNGDRVLWIHGYTLDSTSWEELWLKLPGWTHVGVDLPGHGASRPLAFDETLPALGRAIGAAALAHGIRHVVALSVGTIVALQAAIEHPRVFSSIVLGAPALGGGPQDPGARNIYERVVHQFQQSGQSPLLRAIWMGEESPLFRGLEGCRERWARIADIVDRHTWRELSIGGIYRVASHVQAPADLARIQASVLLLVGEQEMPAFRRSAELIRRAVPSARRVYLPDTGHLCMLQTPELAAASIEAHLRAHA
jgi:pimeloyl-ACP methyl ester carboxylesterase